ncbi:MAG: hypothetical protein ACFCBV_02430 [Phycisphaerales bacterium]
MMKNSQKGPLSVAGLVIAATALLLPLTGCGSEEAQPAEPDASYTTQGRVAMKKTPDSPASEFQIFHESIPNFVNGQGEVIGMNAHQMSFPRVAEDIDVDSLEIGQPVRFTFDVTWTDPTTPVWIVTELEVLPAETTFAFETPAEEEAKPPVDAGG